MANIQVGEPIGDALRRTGDILFRPFNFSKWCALAVAGMLVLVGEGGASVPNFNGMGGSSRSSGRRGGGGSGDISFDDAMTWIRGHVVEIVVVGIILAIILCAIYMLYRWLNARGQFMLFDHVVKNSAEVKQAWRDNRTLGNSFFWFRISWDLVIFNALLAIGVVGFLLEWPDLKAALVGGEYHFTGWSIAAIIVTVLLLIIFGIVLWVLSNFIFHVMLPVMYVRKLPAWQACKTTWRDLFMPNFWKCLVYFLMFMVIGMVEGVWAMVAVLVTCCSISCASIVPVVGMYPLALVMLPVLTFKRAYELLFISQFGPDYQVNWTGSVKPQGFPVMPTQV